MWGTALNPSVRWVQMSLLVMLTVFVGAMWGLERSTVPLLAREEFGIASATVTLSFIVGFGLTKTFANLFGGGMIDRVGGRRVLIAGWAVGLPVPMLIIFAPSWEWVTGANLLLGVNQGLCWTATIVMMQDLLGARYRGLATGLNEFVGYSGVAVATLASGFIAATFAPRPYPYFLGIGLALLGLAMSAFLVRETARPDRLEAPHPGEPAAQHPPSFRRSIVLSLRNRSLLSCSQAGLITKINDATVWGLVPLFLASQGLGVAEISIVAAIYPQVWGVTQLGTGALSDHVGRKPLIVAGMLLQGLGIVIIAMGGALPAWILGASVLGLGTAAVYPTLIAAVGDQAHPSRRASAIGIYRWYRDAGFVVGGLLGGLMADAQGFRPAFLLISGLNLGSALAVWALMVGSGKGVRAVRERTGPS